MTPCITRHLLLPICHHPSPSPSFFTVQHVFFFTSFLNVCVSMVVWKHINIYGAYMVPHWNVCLHACIWFMPMRKRSIQWQQWNAAGIGGLVAVERALSDSCSTGRNSPSASQPTSYAWTRSQWEGKREERNAAVCVNMLDCVVTGGISARVE